MRWIKSSTSINRRSDARPGRTPVTYTGLFTFIRDLFSNLPESRVRGYKPGRYSFNVKGGRCSEACQGDGLIKIEMHFLPDVYVTCEVVRDSPTTARPWNSIQGPQHRRRPNMTVDDALEFLKNIPFIKSKLQTLRRRGLALKLGQSATTLSGGEARRVKLSRELLKRPTGRTMYILDEPTTGLHFADIQRLLDVLDRLVETGEYRPGDRTQSRYDPQCRLIIDLGPKAATAVAKSSAKAAERDRQR